MTSRPLAFVLTVVTALCGAAAVLSYSATRPGGLLMPTLPSPPVQDELVLTLRNPGTVTRLALPDFIVGAAADLNDPSRLVADVLWADLDFEHEYLLIPRAASALLPVAPADALPFEAWTELGADVVLAGSVSGDAAAATVSLRLVSIKPATQGQLAFSADYPCDLSSTRGARDCAHRMADAFHLATRGLVGVARTRLAFVSDRDRERLADRPSSDSMAGATELYLADYDGAGQTRVTARRSITCCPTWAPLAPALAFVSWMAGPPDVYQLSLVDRDAALLRPTRMGPNIQSWSPAWSPDGSKLAFASNRTGNLDIWVINADGTDLRNLTNHPAAEGTPTWSPNGSQIAFASNRTGVNRLYVMSAQGAAPQILVNEKIDRPTWSAQNFIAFTYESAQGQHRIGLYDVGTATTTMLTDGATGDENPSVSPNGRHIVFVTTRWGGEHIAVMDRTGANVRRITTVGRNVYPAWEPAR